MTNEFSVLDSAGNGVMLAKDGGIWVRDNFWPEGNRKMARPYIAFPLRPAPDAIEYLAQEEIEAIMEALEARND